VCWKKLSTEERHSIVGLIDKFYKNASETEIVWSRANVLKLTRFVKLDDVYKLQGCYFASKKDPLILCLQEEEVGNDDINSVSPIGIYDNEDGCAIPSPQQQGKIDTFLSLFPSELIGKYSANKKDAKMQRELYNHHTNRAAQSEWSSSTNIAPSSYLDAAMPEAQATLLNPTYKHVLTGFIMYDVKGKGARNKIAKHQLDMIDGNIGSYSHLLNDSKRLQSLKDYNDLTAMIANVSADADKEKEKRQVVAKQRAADETKKLLDKTKEAAKKTILMPKLAAIMETVTNDVNELAPKHLQHYEISYDTTLNPIPKGFAR
jgi:hypothetical protein